MFPSVLREEVLGCHVSLGRRFSVAMFPSVLREEVLGCDVSLCP
jgi:hypothetical protein